MPATHIPFLPKTHRLSPYCALMAVLLICAWGRPALSADPWGFEPEDVSKPVDVLLLVENTRGMARNLSATLLNELVARFATGVGQDDRVAIFGYTLHAQQVHELSPTRRYGINQFMNQVMSPLRFDGDHADPAMALDEVLAPFRTQRPRTRRLAVVILSHQGVNSGKPDLDRKRQTWLLEGLSADARQLGARIHGVIVSGTSGFELMSKLSRIHGTAYRRADDGAQLSRQLRSLLDNIRPESSAIEAKQEPARTESAAQDFRARQTPPTEPEAKNPGPTKEQATRPAADPVNTPAAALDSKIRADQTEQVGKAEEPREAKPSASTEPEPVTIETNDAIEDAATREQEQSASGVKPPSVQALVPPAPPQEATTSEPTQSEASGIWLWLISGLLGIAAALGAFWYTSRASGDTKAKKRTEQASNENEMPLPTVVETPVPTEEKGSATTPADARLVDLAGVTGTREYPLSREMSVIIGRNQPAANSGANALVIEKGSISRKHAQIDFREDLAAFCIRDLGSTNGTYINNRRIHSEEVLKPGDRIRFDAFEFSFERLENSGLEPDQTVMVLDH